MGTEKSPSTSSAGGDNSVAAGAEPQNPQRHAEPQEAARGQSAPNGQDSTGHQPRPVVLLIEVSTAVIGTATLAVIGAADLPLWALVLLSVGFTAALLLATNALIGPESERVRSLWSTVAVLVATIVGVLIYVNVPGRVPFVNYVANKSVTLSGVAGDPPRTDYDAPTLPPDEENSATCYLVFHGQTWLEFNGGWAPLADFHLAPGARNALPEPC